MQIADCRMQTAECRMQIADCRIQNADYGNKWTQNPNMCTPFWEKRPLATPHISMIRGGTSKDSSDSDMGRRPKLKSDEFSEDPPIVVEIISILVEICTEIMGSLIGIWSPLGTQELRSGSHRWVNYQPHLFIYCRTQSATPPGHIGAGHTG